MREIIHLNEEWYFKPFEPRDLEDIDFSSCQRVVLPHEGIKLPYHYFDETITQSVLTYNKEFHMESEAKNQIIKLRFEGVAHQANLYVNHKFVLSHQGGYTPFEAIINPYIEYDKINTITVVVDGKENPDIPPFGGVVDYLGYVGIYREVSLIFLNPTYIQDVFVYTKDHKMSAHVTLSQPKAITYELLSPTKTVILNKTTQSALKHTLEEVIDDVKLWDLDNPNLYQLNVYTEDDYYGVRFGFRTIEFKKDGFYLNGKSLKLMGLNRHQSYPYVGYAMPKRIQQQDADILKYELGVNVVRSSHYPPSTHFIERCDEIGLLLFEELPGWQHIGGNNFITNGLKAIEEMIIRDRNHPSIILWGVRINESADHHEFYERSNRLARTLDPSRPTGGVRNFSHSEFLEDVYTYNDFSHTGDNEGLTAKKKITKAGPYLVTEHNGHMFPTKKFDPESKRISQALRHLAVMDSAFDPKAGIAGAIGWCMNDYNTHKEFGSGDKICYHGVMDMDRLPKLAAYSYQSQNDQKPFMKVGSTMQNGEYSGGFLDKVVVFTNLDYIKLYRNDTYLDTYYPDKKTYPHLPHPPVIITDFIGETLEKKEHMTKQDAESTKRILRKIQKEGNHLKLVDQLKMLFLLKKYHLTLNDGVRMFYEYTSGWGSKETVYRFEGYLKDQLVHTEIIESTKSIKYHLMGEDTLEITNTYDVIRLVIQKTNQHNQELLFAMDGFMVNTEGPIQLISPAISNLNGGSRAIYIRSTGVGQAKVIVNIDGVTLTKVIEVKRLN